MWIRRNEFNRLVAEVNHLAKIVRNKEKQNKDKAGCIVVCTNDKEEFEKVINNNLEQGYKIISSSCNTKEFKAIMCDKRFSE